MLLTEHNLDLLSLKEGCTSSSESTLLKMPHCWKSHVAAQLLLLKTPSLYNVSLCKIKVFITAVLKIVKNSDSWGGKVLTSY